MKKNPYMIPDPDHPPVFSPDGATVRTRFRYIHPREVESASRKILTRLNQDLQASKSNEDIILAVVRMNRAMLAAHPFQDGNGRSIRLLSDLVFQRYGLPPHSTPTSGTSR
jgi:fido (protein-threonine AMPylation protein)